MQNINSIMLTPFKNDVIICLTRLNGSDIKMKMGKLQYTGILVAIAYAIIMLTVGRVIPQEEVEAKAAAAKTQERVEKLKYISTRSQIKDSDGNELMTIDKDPEAIYTINDGDVFLLSFAFEYFDDEKDSQEPREDELDFLNYYVETNNPSIKFTDLEDIVYHEEFGIVQGYSTVKVDQGLGLGEQELSIRLRAHDDSLVVREARKVKVSIPFIADPEIEKMLEEEKKESKEVKAEDTHRGYLSEEKITSENIEDWDHILDEDEIEDSTFKNGLD